MTQAIVRAESAGIAPAEWTALREQAGAVVRSGFLPKAINTPEKAVALMLAGRELGLGPMQSIRSLHIIDGKPVMSAELMAGLAHRRLPGAMLRIIRSTNEVCEVEAGRPGQQATRFSFTMADAKAAGLLGKDNWRKYPAAMLRARCLAAAARATFPDVLLGVYDPDELGAVTDEEGGVVTLPVQPAPASDPMHPRPVTMSALPLVQAIEDATDHDALEEAKAAAKAQWKLLTKEQQGLVKFAVEEAATRLQRDEPANDAEPADAEQDGR